MIHHLWLCYTLSDKTSVTQAVVEIHVLFCWNWFLWPQKPYIWCITLKNWPKNKEMERFTSDGGHLGRHLEYLKFLNDASWASSRFWFYVPSSTKISKNLLGRYFLQGSPQNQDSAAGLFSFCYCCSTGDVSKLFRRTLKQFIQCVWLNKLILVQTKEFKINNYASIHYFWALFANISVAKR